MQDIEFVRSRNGVFVRVGGVDIPTKGMTDVACHVLAGSVTEVQITYAVSNFRVVENQD